MAKWLKVAGLAVVALLVAASASGDSNTYNYQTQGGVNFNTRNGAVVDGSGNAKVAEALPPYSLARTWTVLDGATLAAAAADSCVPIPMTGKLYSITVKCVSIANGSAGTGVAHLGVTIRNHISGLADSLNTSNFYPAPRYSAASPAADTLILGHINAGSTSVPWSGEWKAVFSGTRLGPNGTTALFPYPNAQTYMLSGIYGSELYGQYVSVRVRNLSITSAPSVRVWVWVTEVPL